jgi:arylsulfatase A-like enzyme
METMAWRGFKISNSEGGVRIPFLIKWPGIIQPGQITDNMIANYDFMATMADLFEQPLDDNRDGISFLNTLREPEKPELQKQHIGIPLSSNIGPAIVTPDGWKLRCILKPAKMIDFGNFGPDGVFLEENVKYLLYNILDDYREERNLAQDHPEIVEHLVSILLKECNGNLVNGTPQAHFTYYSSASFDYSRA